MAETVTTIYELKLRRLTKTLLDNKQTVNENELLLVDPEFTGGKLLSTDNVGNIVESTIASADVSDAITKKFTHIPNSTVSSASTTITFAANQRGSQMISVSADIDITFDVRNLSDNYLWIKNTGNSEIDVTISSVVNDQTAISNVYIPSDGISIPAGSVCEIGILCNADGAFITSRNDLTL